MTLAQTVEERAECCEMQLPGGYRDGESLKVFANEARGYVEKPEAVADAIVALCLPEMTETGKYYDFPARKLVEFRRPGES